MCDTRNVFSLPCRKKRLYNKMKTRFAMKNVLPGTLPRAGRSRQRLLLAQRDASIQSVEREGPRYGRGFVTRGLLTLKFGTSHNARRKN